MQKYYNNIRKAFTMAEIIIALVIIGIICLATIGILKTAMPTKEESLHKKVTALVEQAVERLADNDVMYPKDEDSALFGFKNTKRVVVDGVEYGGQYTNAAGDTVDNRATKFCELFATQFTTTQSPVCSKAAGDDSDGTEESALQRTFSTTDGIDWYIPVTTFSNDYAIIKVDVNGASEGSNCVEGSANCSKPDQFLYYVRANGTVTVGVPNELDDDLALSITLTVENPEGGTYQLGEFKEDGNHVYKEELSASEHVFEDLAPNTKYVIKANPIPGYSQRWESSSGAVSTRAVYGVNLKASSVTLKLKFEEKPTYCITVKVNGCNESNLTGCIEYPVVKDSSTNEEVSLTTVGVPKITDGVAERDSNGQYIVDPSSSSYSYFDCGFNGKYSLNLKTKGDYRFGDSDSMSQELNVPSGSDSHVTYSVTLSQYNPCANDDYAYWNGSQCVCSGDQIWEEDVGCVCPSSKPNFVDGVCVAKECSGGQQWNEETKKCECPGGDLEWDVCSHECNSSCPSGSIPVCGTCFPKWSSWKQVPTWVDNWNICRSVASEEYCNTYCGSGCEDPWINAVIACGGKEYLPATNPSNELDKLASQFYTCSSTTGVCGFNNNLTLADYFGFPYYLRDSANATTLNFFTQEPNTIFTFSSTEGLLQNFDYTYEPESGHEYYVMCMPR